MWFDFFKSILAISASVTRNAEGHLVKAFGMAIVIAAGGRGIEAPRSSKRARSSMRG
jgi:hypothetical protein